MKSKILALTLVSPEVPESVYSRFEKAQRELQTYSASYFDLEWMFNHEIEPHLPNDLVPVSQVARLRNKMIDRYLKDHDYVFWIDSDLVEFKENLLERLVDRQRIENKIIAPQNLVEMTDKWYDWGAFIQAGTSHIQPQQLNQIYGRNLETNPPYFHPGYQRDFPLVKMDSVAQCVLIPASVYKSEIRHIVDTCFYEFFSVCREAKKKGIQTYVDRSLTAFHADRSLYGRNWGTPR